MTEVPSPPPVPPDARLWRRVPEWHWVNDGSGGLRPSSFALAEFPAMVAIDKGQTIVRDPTPLEPAHVLLVGRKTKSVSKALAKASSWAWPPPGRPYPEHEHAMAVVAPESEAAAAPLPVVRPPAALMVLPVVVGLSFGAVVLLVLLLWWA